MISNRQLSFVSFSSLFQLLSFSNVLLEFLVKDYNYYNSFNNNKNKNYHKNDFSKIIKIFYHNLKFIVINYQEQKNLFLITKKIDDDHDDSV